MLVVIPALIAVAARQTNTGSTRVPFPLFIIGFVLACAVRTLGDAWLGADQAQWNMMIDLAGKASVIGFAMAMARPGHDHPLSELKLLGWKPAAAAVVSAGAVLGLALVWTIQTS